MPAVKSAASAPVINCGHTQHSSAHHASSPCFSGCCPMQTSLRLVAFERLLVRGFRRPVRQHKTSLTCPEHQICLVIFNTKKYFFALTCKFCNAWRQAILFYYSRPKIKLRRSKRTPAVYFVACHCIFQSAPQNQTSRKKSQPLQNSHTFCSQCFESVFTSAFFFKKKTRIAIFTLLEKDVLQCNFCTALFIFGCILEQCIFYTGSVKRSSAKQNGCSGWSPTLCREDSVKRLDGLLALDDFRSFVPAVDRTAIGLRSVVGFMTRASDV